MATTKKITLIQGDDPSVGLVIKRKHTDGTLEPYDLSGKRVELLVKDSRETPDASKRFQISSAGVDPMITITNATAGLATANFTDELATAGEFWYRSWVADESDETLDRDTWVMGDFIILAA